MRRACQFTGDLTCRAPSSAATCAGTVTQLRYDTEGQLTAWQNAPSNPSAIDTFLYDGVGRRVEPVTTSGGTTSTTTYYAADGKLLADLINGAFSFVTTTARGSASALNTSGSTTAAQLYAPYCQQPIHVGHDDH